MPFLAFKHLYSSFVSDLVLTEFYHEVIREKLKIASCCDFENI